MHKNLYLLYLIIILFVVSCETESPNNADNESEVEDIIAIPDEYFKAALVSTNSIDTNNDGLGDSDIDLNNDGEIQRSEAQLIEGLIIEFNNTGRTTTIDLSGIENFVNLKYIKMKKFIGSEFNETYNNLVTYDFTALKKLEFLELDNMPTYYTEFLDLSALNNLTGLKLINSMPGYSGSTDSDHFTKINLDGCTNLTSLDMYNSYLIIDF